MLFRLYWIRKYLDLKKKKNITTCIGLVMDITEHELEEWGT